MQVDPTRLVELAASCEGTLDAMAQDWAGAVDELAQACAGLGDATGTLDVQMAYAASLDDAAEVVAALSQALALGIAGLVDAAQDALRADDVVATELEWTAHQVADEGFGVARGHGGR